jgi:hypothetical protein
MRPRVLTTAFLAIMMAWLGGTSPGLAQVRRIPTGLELIPASKEANQGSEIAVTVGLINYKADRIAAPQSIDVTIDSNLLKRAVRVTIPAGRESARSAIVFDRPGIAKLTAAASGLANAYAVIAVRSGPPRASWEMLFDRLTAGVRDFYPRLSASESESPCATADETPKRGGLSLTMIPPHVAARNGRWSATVVVALVNDEREPIAAIDDTEITISPKIGVAQSERIVIPKGHLMQEVRVTSSGAGCDTIYAWSPSVRGMSTTHVEYERSRPSKLIVSPTAPDAVANGWTRVPIAVLLKDDDNHVVTNPDKDLRVVLRSSLGTLSKTAVTVARGQSDSDEAVLSSRQRGRARITADAEGLGSDPEFVTFTLPWLLIPLSIGGGVSGAIVRSPRRRRRANLLIDLAMGGMLGFVLFGFALFGVPTLAPALSTDMLANLTLNEIGAVLLGFLGGYVGRRYLNRLTGESHARQDAVATS